MIEQSHETPAQLGAGAPVLAFDVGGTETKSALIDQHGKILGLRKMPTAASDDPVRTVIDSLSEVAGQLMAEFPAVQPCSAGVGVPGIVDEASGMGFFSSNLGWRDVPIRDLAIQELGIPIALCHDVRAAAQAELMLGAARGFRNVVILVIGTGIAGSIIIDGTMYVSGGNAGEFGHSLSDPNGELCLCGAVGCLETIASASAIVRRYSVATGIEAAGAQDVHMAAQRGDRVAQQVWDDAVNALGDELARIASIIAPEAIVIGGGLSRAGASYVGALRERMDSRLSFHRRPQLLQASLGGDAGLYGAALAARELVTVS